MGEASWTPTKKYRKDLWAVFVSKQDEFSSNPLGYLEQYVAESLINNVKDFRAIQLRLYAKWQPGKAERMLPLPIGEGK